MRTWKSRYKETQAMDFIERIFGVSPDNGSGLLEMVILLVPMVAIVLLIRYSRRQKKV
jgi:hypothetical protein